MLERFYPQRRLRSAYEIPYEQYLRKGFRGVIFDIDNTLVPHNAPADGRARELFSRLHAMGFQTCLLSNNREPRVREFAGEVDSPYIFKAGKPKIKGFERAMEKMGTGQKDTLFVGDQLFTDVYGANRAGVYSILTDPINPREELQIVLKRFLERPLLKAYERRERKGRRAGKTEGE